MVSQAKGYLRVPVWIDSGIVKPIADNAGRIPVTIEGLGITLDVNLESSDITLPVSTNADTSSIKAHAYRYWRNAWHIQPIQIGYDNPIAFREEHKLISDTDWTLMFTSPNPPWLYVITTINAYTDSDYCERITVSMQYEASIYELFIVNEPSAYQQVGGACNIIIDEDLALRADFKKPGINATVVGVMAGYRFSLE